MIFLLKVSIIRNSRKVKGSMENYKIRYATQEDVLAIKRFIDDRWKKDHILAREKGFFEWQYTSDKLDYVLGIDINGNVQGMLGFISYDDGNDRDIATSMWMANRGTGFLGIKLLMYVMDKEPHRTIFSLGINVKTTRDIYERLNFSTGRMNQWYRLRKLESYTVAKIVDARIPKYIHFEEVRIVRYLTVMDLLADFDFEKYVSSQSVPYKSLTYLKRRYFEHPIYEYLIYGVKRDGRTTNAVVVFRVQECNAAKVLRFVDCIGNIEVLGGITYILDELLVEFDAEYIDLYEKGLCSDMLRTAGWIRLDETDNIIPNYFSPFEQCNVDVSYCTSDENIVLFRGDGDQDRPN